MKNPRNTEAVSEILGEIILLAIAVTCISVIYTQVLSIPGPTDTTDVTIIGKIEGGYPVFELQRGESLGPDTKIIITLAGLERTVFLQKDIIGNQEWNIGERIVLPPVGDRKIRVEGTIVDTKTNSIIFWGLLHEGFTVRYKGGIWHFDEPSWNGTYDEVKDSSGNNNHGQALNQSKLINGTLQPQNVTHNNSGYFNGYMDCVQVNTSWTLNITKSITITAWMKPEVRRAIADLVKVEGNFGYTPYVIHVVGSIYAMVSEDKEEGQSFGCRLSTVEITALGDINPIQNVYFGNASGKKTLRPIITQISEKLYLVSFNDQDGYIHLRTYNISDEGFISNKADEKICKDYKIDLDPTRPNRPSQLRITQNICAIAYWCNGLNNKEIGILKTLYISSNGKIAFVENMTYELGYEPCLVYVTGEVYALAYRNVTNHGILKTFTISPTGHIQPIDVSVYSEIAFQPSLIKVSGDVFAVAYRDANSYGYVKIINILPNGIIEPTNETEMFENTAGNCFNPCITHVTNDMYVVAYSTADSSGYSIGYIVTLKLLKNGSIGPIDTRKEFELSGGKQTRCFNPIIIRLSEYLYAISYEGFGNHPGKLITLLIGKIPRGICKGLCYTLFANTTNVVGIINGVELYYNNSLGDEWHHYALTYDGMSIRLYVDNVTVDEEYYPNHLIKVTPEPLYLGRFYCGFIDEVGIYDIALTNLQIGDLYEHFDTHGILEKYLI